MNDSHPKEGRISSDYVKDFYNGFLAGNKEEYADYRWFGTSFARFQYKQTKRVLEKILIEKKFPRFLEVGGGDGVWTELLLPHVEKLDFLDISKEMILRAERRLASGSVHYILGDFLSNSLVSGSYDGVMSVRNFEYFSDKKRGMAEFGRLLKGGGELILITKNPDFDWTGYYRSKKLHSDIMSVPEIVHLLKKEGFVVNRVTPAIFGKKLNSYFPRACFDALHILQTNTPLRLPFFITRFFSESFLIHATRIS